MDIYIKPTKKVMIAGNEQKTVCVKDIAEVIAPDEIESKIKNLKLLIPKSKKEKSYLISIIDIISAIDKSVPGHTINNVGEMDTLIEYSPIKVKENVIFKWAKILFVSIVLLTGSATALMCFHTDTQLPEIFKNFYYIFFNEKVENPIIIELPYSIGVAIGIIVFFNHFAGKKITSDPTPIEVQMSNYDTEVSDTIIDVLNTEKMHSVQGKKDE